MANISSLEKLKELSFKTTSLAIAIVVFYLSSLYLDNSYIRLTFVLQQTAIFALLGFLHAYNVYSLDNIINRQKQNMVMLFCYFLVYTAWYNVVLFPMSGLGLIEYGIVFVVLSSNLYTEIATEKKKNPFMGQKPMVLVYFGMILFLIKIIIFFTITGDNIYDSLILENETARFLVGIFSVVGVVFLIMQLCKHITNKFEINVNKSKTEKIFSFVFSVIKKGITAIISIISLPIIIIVMLIIGLGVLAIGAIELNGIYNDILKFVEHLLEKSTSTGENSLQPSNFYFVFQTISMIIVLFYTSCIEDIMKENIIKNIEMRIVNEIDKLEINDKEQLLNETKKMLIDNRFNEQLKLLDKLDKNNTMIKDTIASINEKQN